MHVQLATMHEFHVVPASWAATDRVLDPFVDCGAHEITFTKTLWANMVDSPPSLKLHTPNRP